MTKRKRKRLFQDNHVYTAKQVCDICSVTPNTVVNWKKAGLHPSDDKKPNVFQGSQLNAFRKARQSRNKTQLSVYEFKCLSCNEIFVPRVETVEWVLYVTNGNAMVRAQCIACNGCATKILNATHWDMFEKCIKTNSSLESIDEVKAGFQAEILCKTHLKQSKFYFTNDRILIEYIKYCGKYAAKTLAAHLIAIRDLERFIEGLPFHKLTTTHLANYRDDLIQTGKAVGEGSLGRSTILHRASQIRQFLIWLMKQKGYRKLDKTLPDYLDLPKAMMAKVKLVDHKVYPTPSEAEAMFETMPRSTWLERRQAAIFASAFVTGLRANALAGLLLKDVDLEERVVVQDGTNGRAKNGKTIRVQLFPISDILCQVFMDWVNELLASGAQGKDAVFPTLVSYQKWMDAKSTQSVQLEPMADAVSVRKAFKIASKAAKHNFTPHSARHCLVAKGIERCRTLEDFKAWSLNLGHDEIEITLRNYGYMADIQRFDVLERINSYDPGSSDDKELLIQFTMHEMEPSNPDYPRAKALFDERKRAG